MIPLENFENERTRLLNELRDLASAIKYIVEGEIHDLSQGIQMLETLRQKGSESINQLQHAAMILQAASELATRDFAGEEVRWKWNARQTGSIEEPDLQGEVNEDIVISVEVTTSRRPIGMVDQRMAGTLDKLSHLPGKRVYYVRTPEMETRALTKVEKGAYDIEVRMLGIEAGS